MVGFVNAACVHPAVFQAVFPSLSATELKFCIASLTPARSVLQILKGHLIFIPAPGVREDCVRWGIVDIVLSQTEFTTTAPFQ
jgi:hypothetical protein